MSTMSAADSSASLAEIFRSLPKDQRMESLESLTENEAEALLHDWDSRRREHPLAGPGAGRAGQLHA